jgi:hypothetical protein
MCSKFLIAVFAVTIVSTIVEACTQQPATELVTDPPATEPATTKGFAQLYHPCPRSLLSYQFLFENGPRVRCAFGPEGNLCRGNEACPDGQYCCQDDNGCNQCVGKKH